MATGSSGGGKKARMKSYRLTKTPAQGRSPQRTP